MVKVETERQNVSNEGWREEDRRHVNVDQGSPPLTIRIESILSLLEVAVVREGVGDPRVVGVGEGEVCRLREALGG